MDKGRKSILMGNLKRILMVFVLVLTATLTATLSRVYATPVGFDPSEGIDVILVIDTSGSMRTADPERITLEAAALFMDMMETRNSRIGVVSFSGALHSVMPLTHIGDPGVRDDIRNTISGFVYHGWTDVGLGLRTAAEMLLNDPSPNSPMILLFTDGRIDMPANWNNRGIDVSYQDAWWAVENVGSFTPIYTIGLNYDGTINTEFLQEIASRTSANSYIINDAAMLPQIFNEIFASHIRSSITEVASIVTDGVEYTDIIIPIPSPFVAEANIIMLSTQPIDSIRLFSPDGNEVYFDDHTYILTTANRYSMAKIIFPMVGDWLLSVRGLPEDYITVNLIYNYDVDVSFSITQENMRGAFFDPNSPILIQASFITPLSIAQIQTLFTESTAELHVYDLDFNLLEILPMPHSGAAFAINFMPYTPQDVRIRIYVQHPNFTQTTALVTIHYEPSPEPETIPTPEPETEPHTEAEQETTLAAITALEETQPPIIEAPEEADEGSNRLIILAFFGIAVSLITIAVLLLHSYSKPKLFKGHLEIRALLHDGKYTSLEVPDLSTFAKRISLKEFIDVSLGNKAARIFETKIPIGEIYIQPGVQNGRPVLILTTNGACHITDADGHAILQRKFVWEKDLELIFSIVDSPVCIEITYRINNN